MKFHYSKEKNVQLLVYLLKTHNIKKIVASPGTTNVSFLSSLQCDPFFEIYSCVDERSAAYMACGIAEESGEVVVLSCTGATASRNYISALTEAYYSKLPILAVTSTQDTSKVGHNIAQVIDRSVIQNDIAKLSIHLQNIKNDNDLWDCEIKANKAILELNHNGKGPVHINLETTYNKNNSVEVLPEFRVINRIMPKDNFPTLSKNKVAIHISSHAKISNELSLAIDTFCEKYNSVVFCDHTSNYYGKYKINYSIVASQEHNNTLLTHNIVISLGNITGDYSCTPIFSSAKEVWRVNEDGKLVDTHKKLRYIFEMNEERFFENYITTDNAINTSYFEYLKEALNKTREKIPELPFSNIWIAQHSSPQLPKGSKIHLAILNTLRAWNFFDLPETVRSMSNIGGFGIDGCLSSLIGSSFCNKEKLYFSFIGDLAFFYDLNSIGNRHISNNLRILLVNNGVGTEFKNYNHNAARFAEDADAYIAASGHFGKQSKELVKNYAQNLGFKYLSASNKDEFNEVSSIFFNSEIGDKPIFLEVFTKHEEESLALKTIKSITEINLKLKLKKSITKRIGIDNVNRIKKIFK